MVTVLVEAELHDRTAAPPRLIERLRRLEFEVSEAAGDRQALQVIASARRLLGDAEEIPKSGISSGIDFGAEPS
ncbi:hypothetical protein [Methylobacterium sp. Leaf117]|uniref:hypothetical protein n=1 Tax=Methylobacterium sp. Leaf117 TaxID=1736260 RepID=UPI0006FF347B|nr:hypothetical protein [Methylobacterium sp. Leaf117]KQP80281.1 hypothetical protein ASF57_18005 [Methylobacterium sp. Leaf117]